MERKKIHISKIRALNSQQLGQVFKENGHYELLEEVVKNQLTGADIFDKTIEEWKNSIALPVFKIHHFTSFLIQIKEDPEFLHLPFFSKNTKNLENNSTIMLDENLVETFKKIEEIENNKPVIKKEKPNEIKNYPKIPPKKFGNSHEKSSLINEKRKIFETKKQEPTKNDENRKFQNRNSKLEKTISVEEQKLKKHEENSAEIFDFGIEEKNIDSETERNQIFEAVNKNFNHETGKKIDKNEKPTENLEKMEFKILHETLKPEKIGNSDTLLKPRVNRHLKPKPPPIREKIYENLNSRGKLNLSEAEVKEELNTLKLPPKPGSPTKKLKPPEPPIQPLPPKPPKFTQENDSKLKEKFEPAPEIDVSDIPKPLKEFLDPPPPPDRDIVPNSPGANVVPEEYLVPVGLPPSRIQNVPLPESPVNIILHLEKNEAEENLKDKKEGSFLYRVSTRDEFYSTLVVKAKEKIYNIPVIYKANNYYLKTSRGEDDEFVNRFRSLDQLTEFYTKNDLLIGNKSVKLIQNNK